MNNCVINLTNSFSRWNLKMANVRPKHVVSNFFISWFLIITSIRKLFSCVTDGITLPTFSSEGRCHETKAEELRSTSSSVPPRILHSIRNGTDGWTENRSYPPRVKFFLFYTRGRKNPGRQSAMDRGGGYIIFVGALCGTCLSSPTRRIEFLGGNYNFTKTVYPCHTQHSDWIWGRFSILWKGSRKIFFFKVKAAAAWSWYQTSICCWR